jgi:hypothetical protein
VTVVDILESRRAFDNAGLDVRFKDMGDGSFAEQLFLAGVSAGLGLATEATLLHKHGKVIPIVGAQNVLNPQVIFGPSTTPARTPGTSLRVCRVWVHGADSIPDNSPVEFKLTVGDDLVDHDEVIRDAPYVNSTIRESDAIDETLTLELLSAQKVYFNVACQEF